MLMIVVLYALLDRKLREYGQVIALRNTDVLYREMRSLVSGTGSMLDKYPTDFDVFRLGEMDTETGVITPCPVLFVENVGAILRPVGFDGAMSNMEPEA